MKLSQLDRFNLEPAVKICCNCAFCDKYFRTGDHYCSLRDAISKILNIAPASRISSIFNTTCDMFTSRDDLAKMLEVEKLEEFEMLKTLGKFSSIPEEIVKMRSNFFSDKHDATSKQIQYMRYLATSNLVVPPLKLGSSHECDIDHISDKSMMRSWISLEVSRRLKSAMI